MLDDLLADTRVFCANSATLFLRLVAAEPLSISWRGDLVLVDFAMPGMNGMEVAREVHIKFPALPILFITGYADKTALQDISDARIIKKPFVGDELANKVHAALASLSPRSASKVVPLR